MFTPLPYHQRIPEHSYDSQGSPSHWHGPGMRYCEQLWSLFTPKNRQNKSMHTSFHTRYIAQYSTQTTSKRPLSATMCSNTS